MKKEKHKLVLSYDRPQMVLKISRIQKYGLRVYLNIQKFRFRIIYIFNLGIKIWRACLKKSPYTAGVTISAGWLLIVIIWRDLTLFAKTQLLRCQSVRY